MADAQVIKVPYERMAGYHYSVAFTSEVVPNSAILTYPVKDFDILNYNLLVKLMPCLSVEDKIIYPSSFTDMKVEDFPGGVAATFSFENTTITTRITPLLTGRGIKTWTGAAVYEISTSPAREVVVLLGKGNTLSLLRRAEKPYLNSDSVNVIGNYTRMDSLTIGFRSGKEGLNVAVRCSDPVSVGKIGDQKNQAYVRMPGGAGFIMTVFSERESDIKNLTTLDAMKEQSRVSVYYDKLLKTSVYTPEKVMNDAFTSAIYNLEYSWFEPFGWGECLHHWLALWHMQVGAAADLIGQTDRSESTIMELASNLLTDGSIPQFIPNKITRRDFGGSNQYWVWQVRHYLNYTGDKAFAKMVMPYVETVISQTLKEYDKDGDFLASWGLQIGNQEDFVANPYNGSVPSMELLNMFMTGGELSEFIGDTITSKLWFSKAEMIRSRLYKELWMKDLGRFAYYKDPAGVLMPDGQYETYLYPVIYDLVDDYDKYSGLRHLKDRLTRADGAVFLSNNFPWHATGIASTWGMQCGEAQQPWAAMGFSGSGLNNETWKPLKAMADWAQDINHRGAWPETGPEPTPAYFTPPAGLYLVAVVESLFGITLHSTQGYVEISPSLPDNWPYAKLNLPDFQIDYSREKNQIKFNIISKKDLPLKVKWRLPVSNIIKCTVNGEKVPYNIIPGVNNIALCFDVLHSLESDLIIEYEPIAFKVNALGSIAVGEKLDVSVEGAKIERIMDRYGVLEDIMNRSASSFSSKIQKSLLDPYLSFNQLGLLNFSRRTFFLDCLTPDGSSFIAPVDLTILPRYEAASAGFENKPSSGILKINVRNNTGETRLGEAIASIAGNDYIVQANIKAHSESIIEVPVSSDLGLSSGDNIAALNLPGEVPLTIHFNIVKPANNPHFAFIDLPEENLIPDTLWTTLRNMPGFPHIFFTFTDYGTPKPMWALKNVRELEVSKIPGLKFHIPGNNFIPVSYMAGKVSFKLELKKEKYKKLYLLVIPFVDNHNIFAPVARVTASVNNEIVYSRTLNYPGDVDYWVPDKNPTSFASFRKPRPDPYGLLPLLKPEMSDWQEGKPPEFPQPEWWSTSLPLVTASCVMSIIEISLEKPGNLDNLIFETVGVMPAFGIVAVTAELE